MYTLKDNGILEEIRCGSNFGYILGNNSYFMNTDYKVLQSQTSGIFIPCMKMLYNGKTELYYMVDDYQSMSSMLDGIMPDTLIRIVINLFANVIETRDNGFLTCQNIDLSWDKIYVDASTLKVKLIYLPINAKVFDGYPEFESELRSRTVKLINRVVAVPNSRVEQFIQDLSNGSLTLEDIYHKTYNVELRREIRQQSQNNNSMGSDSATGAGDNIRMIALNAPEYFEIVVDRNEMVIGKKRELADVAIPFSGAISRRHCRITRSNGMYYITDEGSTNGTYVNRVRLAPNQESRIERGDIIRLADSDFRIV